MALAGASPLVYGQVVHRPSTDGVANVVIAASSQQQVTVPAGARAALFSFNADIWVTYGASTVGAVAPAVNTSAGSTASAELNPTIRYFGSTAGTTAINIGSESACKGSVAFYY